MDIDSLTSAWLPSSEGTGNSRNLGKEEFLHLLTTQLTNQDPLSPMENTDFIAQLAQFSSLEQMMGTNRWLEVLALAQSSMTSASAVGYIGHEVEAVGNQIEVTDGVPTWAGLHLEDDAKSVEVEIRNEDGEIVQVIDLGPHSAGDVELGWDGLDLKGNPVPDGEYSFSVKATDAEGGEVGAQTRIRGLVTGISFEKGYAEILLGERRLGLADVVGMY